MVMLLPGVVYPALFRIVVLTAEAIVTSIGFLFKKKRVNCQLLKYVYNQGRLYRKFTINDKLMRAGMVWYM